MKNKPVWLFFIFVILLVSLGIWWQRPGLPVEKVLMSHPLVFGRLLNVEKHIHEVSHSDFGKNIASIDLAEVLTRNHFSPRDIREFRHWQKDFVQFINNPLIKRFLRKEAAFAIYHKDNSYQVFVVLRLTLSTRMAELLGHLSNHWGDNVIVKRQTYQGHTINHVIFKDQGFGIAYVRLRDLLIIAPQSLGGLEEIIDAYKHQSLTLDNDQAFNFIRHNSYALGDGLGFVNLNLFSDIWRGEVDSHLTSLGYHTAAFPIYGLSYLPGEVSKYKVIIGMDQKHMPSDMRQVFNCPALANDTLKLVPVDAIAYHWGGCYDFGRYWAMVRQSLDQNPDLSQEVIQLKHRLEKHFNVNIKKDILPLIGNEIGGYLTDLDMQGSYPFPRLLFFVKIKDRLKAEHWLNTFTDASPIEIKREAYHQVDIRYISLPWGANMDPGYGFLGDYLLMATSRQLIKMSIDAYSNSLRSIVSDDVIDQFKLGGGAKFHSVTLMKTAELSRRAEDFLAWIDKYLAGQVTMAAAYKQDGDNKKQQLDEAIADKSAELLLAQKKLTELKNPPSSGMLQGDPQLITGAIENLNREEQSIKDDIASYTQQKVHLSKVLDNYALGAQSAKLTMYNMENLVSPVLKGLESINAQAVTVRYGEKELETEFLVK